MNVPEEKRLDRAGEDDWSRRKEGSPVSTRRSSSEAIDGLPL